MVSFYEHPNNQPRDWGLFGFHQYTRLSGKAGPRKARLPVQFYQREGADNFWLDRRGRSEVILAVSRGSEIQVACRHAVYPSTTYQFAMDFSDFSQAMAKVEGRDNDGLVPTKGLMDTEDGPIVRLGSSTRGWVVTSNRSQTRANRTWLST